MAVTNRVRKNADRTYLTSFKANSTRAIDSIALGMIYWICAFFVRS
ncbi:MAG: hypothetical protein ACRC62_24455 [Microcoleus sp.]